MPSKKLIFVLFFTFSVLSFFKLFKITTKESTGSKLPLSPIHSNSCDLCAPTVEHPPHESHVLRRDAGEVPMSPKEYRLLRNRLSRRAPCNLLFFGLNPQLLRLAALNREGTTVFLEDDAEEVRRAARKKLKGVSIYAVGYRGRAGEAYELLRHARAHAAACAPRAGPLRGSRCMLAPTALPEVVHRRRWDVVVVDGPSGGKPEAPGRMGAIYAAAVVARAGRNVTDVFVHDVDRTIEKWYSWEFLCQQNLASSKGKLWHFKLRREPRSARFCHEAASRIQKLSLMEEIKEEFEMAGNRKAITGSGGDESLGVS